jgi:hypothetical protein
MMNNKTIITNKFLSLAVTAIIGLSVLTGSLFAQVQVSGYYKSNGTYVKPHLRTAPDSSPYNNYSYPGNYNPNKGKVTTGSQSSYLNNYYNNSSSGSSNSSNNYSGYNNYNNNSGSSSSSNLYNSNSSNSNSIWDW